MTFVLFAVSALFIATVVGLSLFGVRALGAVLVGIVALPLFVILAMMLSF